MSRRPIWTIFILMTASIMTAGVYHTWQLSHLHERSGLSNFASHLGAKKSFAVENDCSGDRLYLEKEISRMAPIFREPRWRRTQDFPKECVLGSLNFAATVAPEAGHYWCSEHGLYEVKPPCASETFVNVIDNVIADITDCFEIAPRDFLVLAAERSALELNCVKAQGDHPTDLKAMAVLQKHEKVSCDRVQMLAQAQILPNLKGKVAEVCEGLKTPFLPLIQMASHLQKLQSEFDSHWAANEMRLNLDDNQRLQLRGWSYFLASEIGTDRAVDLAENFIRTLPETPGRGLSSEGEGHHGFSEKYLQFLKGQTDAKTYQSFERVLTWQNLMFANSLKAQCLPDSLAIQ